MIVPPITSTDRPLKTPTLGLGALYRSRPTSWGYPEVNVFPIAKHVVLWGRPLDGESPRSEGHPDRADNARRGQFLHDVDVIQVNRYPAVCPLQFERRCEVGCLTVDVQIVPDLAEATI